MVFGSPGAYDICKKVGAAHHTCVMVYMAVCSPSRDAISTNVKTRVLVEGQELLDIYQRVINQLPHYYELYKHLTPARVEQYISSTRRNHERYIVEQRQYLEDFKIDFDRVANKYDELLFALYPHLAPPPPEPVLVEDCNDTAPEPAPKGVGDNNGTATHCSWVPIIVSGSF